MSPGTDEQRRRLYVVISGPPASGKSTLAAAVSPRLGLPLIAKDRIKDVLVAETDGTDDLQVSRGLGRTAVMVMLEIARACPGAVLDSVWLPYTVEHLRALEGVTVEVRCELSRETALARFRERAQGDRGGHLDDQRPADELWNDDLTTPLDIGPLIRVDTEQDVDVDRVIDRIRRAISRQLIIRRGAESCCE